MLEEVTRVEGWKWGLEVRCHSANELRMIGEGDEYNLVRDSSRSEDEMAVRFVGDSVCDDQAM